MFYLYVKRDYMNIDIATVFNSEFAQMKHEIWINENNFRNCLMNTLYIAIVHCGARDTLSDKNIFTQFFLKTLEKNFLKKIDNALKSISETSVKILQQLELYGADLLSIVKKDDKLVSEPLSFIYYLIHLHDKNIEISKVDYSKILSFNLEIEHKYNYLVSKTDNKIDLGFDGKIMSSNDQEKSSFAAVISLKGIYSLETKYTDQILSLDQKMLIYESIRITDKTTYLDFLNTQQKIYQVSRMLDVLDSVEKQIKILETSPCIKSQISILIIADTKESLDQKLNQTKQLFFDIGISIVREDYNMMGSMLGVIPCNTYFLRRENYNVVQNSSTFVSIKPKSLGGYRGSIWGKPITIFKTIEGLPYFFNFHNKDDIGHTIMVGKPINKQYLLRYFLICESFKFDLRLVNFDYENFDDEIMTICNVRIKSNFSLDLLRIINNDPEMLYKIFLYVLFEGFILSDEIESQIIKIIHSVTDLISQSRSTNEEIEKIIENINNIIESNSLTINSDIRSYLNEFFSLNCFFKFLYVDTKLDAAITSLNLGNLIQNSIFEDGIKEKIKSLLVFAYLKDLNHNLDFTNATQTLLSVEHGVLKFGKIFHNEFIKIFEELAKKHVVVIINCQNRLDLYHSSEIASIIQNVIPTRFFLSDKFVDNEFKNIFQLSYSDLNKIKIYSPTECIFLFKQDDESMMSSFRILNNYKVI